MIKNSKQNWTVGATVKVGFMANLLVVAKIPTPGDYAPDAYILSAGDRWYSFVPHKGLARISEDEVRKMVAHSDNLNAKIIADAASYASSTLSAAKLRAEILTR